jgi:hypothetical protein
VAPGADYDREPSSKDWPGTALIRSMPSGAGWSAEGLSQVRGLDTYDWASSNEPWLLDRSTIVRRMSPFVVASGIRCKSAGVVPASW